MDADKDIKPKDEKRAFPAAPREQELIYCHRCARMMMVYRPTMEDLRHDPTLDDYIGDHYCEKCIKDIVGDSNDK